MVEVYATALVLMVLVFFELLSQGRCEKYFATKSIWIFIWFLFSVLFFSMAATRVGGSDWVNYKSLFNTISYSTSFGEALSENRLIEPGYVALNHFVAWVGGSRRDVVYIESAITAFGIFLLSTQVPGGSIIAAWLSTLIFIGVMPVRQTVAIAIAMIIFTTVSSKKKYFAALVATSFHISAIPLLVTAILSGKRLGKYEILSVVFLQ